MWPEDFVVATDSASPRARGGSRRADDSPRAGVRGLRPRRGADERLADERRRLVQPPLFAADADRSRQRRDLERRLAHALARLGARRAVLGRSAAARARRRHLRRDGRERRVRRQRRERRDPLGVPRESRSREQRPSAAAGRAAAWASATARCSSASSTASSSRSISERAASRGPCKPSAGRKASRSRRRRSTSTASSTRASPAASAASAAASKRSTRATASSSGRSTRFRGPAKSATTRWPQDNEIWMDGGAPVWNTPAVDPELGLIYFATGNPGPDYNGSIRRRRQLVLDVDRRRRREDGRVPLALPASASRHLGLRRRVAGDAVRHRAERRDAQRPRARRARRAGSTSSTARTARRSSASTSSPCRRSRGKARPRRSRTRAATRSFRSRSTSRPRARRSSTAARSSRRSGRRPCS